MVGYELEKIVFDLYRQNKWKEIIELNNNENDFEKHRILWVWPNFDDLDWLKNVINKKNVSEIVSIGCGSGLLEWIIQKHLGEPTSFSKIKKKLIKKIQLFQRSSSSVLR